MGIDSSGRLSSWYVAFNAKNHTGSLVKLYTSTRLGLIQANSQKDRMTGIFMTLNLLNTFGPESRVIKCTRKGDDIISVFLVGSDTLKFFVKNQ